MLNFSTIQIDPTRIKPIPQAKNIPNKLILQFSSAAHCHQINQIFNKDLKKEFDPYGFVKARPIEEICHQINNGGAAFISDENGKIHTICFAYQHKTSLNNKEHIFTEIGTVMTRLNDFNTAKIVLAAQALKAAKGDINAQPLIAKVDPSNLKTLNFFESTLQWRRITDPATIKAYCQSSAAVTIKHKNYSDLRIWFECTDKTIERSASIISSLRQNPHIYNKLGRGIDIIYNAHYLQNFIPE